MTRSRFQLSQRAREEIAAYLFLSPWIIGFVIFTLGAMAASLVLSFTKTDLLTSIRFVGLDNYAALFTDRFVPQALRSQRSIPSPLCPSAQSSPC